MRMRKMQDISSDKPCRLRVLIITPWYPPYRGIFISNYADAISLFTEVIVLHLHQNENIRWIKIEAQPATDQENKRLIRISYPKCLWKFSLIRKIINAISLAIVIIWSVLFILRKKIQFDLIHVQVLTRCGLLAYILHH